MNTPQRRRQQDQVADKLHIPDWVVQHGVKVILGAWLLALPSVLVYWMNVEYWRRTEALEEKHRVELLIATERKRAEIAMAVEQYRLEIKDLDDKIENADFEVEGLQAYNALGTQANAPARTLKMEQWGNRKNRWNAARKKLITEGRPSP